MKYAIIENGVVTNVAASESPLAENWVLLDEGFSIGDSYLNGSFSKRKEDAEAVLAAKVTAIRSEFESVSVDVVTDANGIVWRGGEGSALSIKGAVDLAEFAGIAQINLRDADRNSHVMTLQEAKAVAATIAAKYQSDFQNKEDALFALENINLSASDAIDKINAVTLGS